MKIEHHFKNNRLIKLEVTKTKKIINKKTRNDFMISFTNFKYPKGFGCYIQSDSNIWWSPKLIKKKHGWLIGWLFISFGYMNFKNLK